MNDHRGPDNPNPARKPKGPVRKSDRVYANRVPSALTPERQREAVRAVRAGRSIHQVAAEFSVSETVISELWMRDVQRKTREFMDALQQQIQEIDDELRGRKPWAQRQVA